MIDGILKKLTVIDAGHIDGSQKINLKSNFPVIIIMYPSGYSYQTNLCSSLYQLNLIILGLYIAYRDIHSWNKHSPVPQVESEPVCILSIYLFIFACKETYTSQVGLKMKEGQKFSTLSLFCHCLSYKMQIFVILPFCF